MLNKSLCSYQVYRNFYTGKKNIFYNNFFLFPTVTTVPYCGPEKKHYTTSKQYYIYIIPYSCFVHSTSTAVTQEVELLIGRSVVRLEAPPNVNVSLCKTGATPILHWLLQAQAHFHFCSSSNNFWTLTITWYQIHIGYWCW